MKRNYIKTMRALKEIARNNSGDRRTQVGAAVFINNKRIWGTNHLACDLPEYDIVNRTAVFYDNMIHAEIDMLSKLEGVSIEGCTVYVTLFPCNNCAKALIEAGVKRIIAGEDRPDASYIIEAKRLLDAAGVSWEVI